MFKFKCILLVACVGLVACDEGTEDVERVAADLDLELEADEVDEDEAYELVDGADMTLPPPPTREGVVAPETPLSLTSENEPDALKPAYECSGDPEGGTWVCCIPWGPYDVPYCCWWGGSKHSCG